MASLSLYHSADGTDIAQAMGGFTEDQAARFGREIIGQLQYEAGDDIIRAFVNAIVREATDLEIDGLVSPSPSHAGADGGRDGQ